MLARMLRRIAWWFVAVPSLLGESASRRATEIALADLRDMRQRCYLAEDKAERLTADLEHAIAWRDKEIARLKSEADIYRAKSVLSLESQNRE